MFRYTLHATFLAFYFRFSFGVLIYLLVFLCGFISLMKTYMFIFFNFVTRGLVSHQCTVFASLWITPFKQIPSSVTHVVAWKHFSSFSKLHNAPEYLTYPCFRQMTLAWNSLCTQGWSRTTDPESPKCLWLNPKHIFYPLTCYRTVKQHNLLPNVNTAVMNICVQTALESNPLESDAQTPDTDLILF